MPCAATTRLPAIQTVGPSTCAADIDQVEEDGVAKLRRHWAIMSLHNIAMDTVPLNISIVTPSTYCATPSTLKPPDDEVLKVLKVGHHRHQLVEVRLGEDELVHGEQGEDALDVDEEGTRGAAVLACKSLVFGVEVVADVNLFCVRFIKNFGHIFDVPDTKNMINDQ